MPISSYTVIPEVLNTLVQAKPKTVLDLGIGNGMYGALVHNYLPETKIVGVEGFERYENPLWAVYDHVIIAKLPGVLDSLTRFDAIICCDVIEHLTKAEGHKLVDMCSALSDLVIISTPAVFVEQGAVGGNELEIHKTLWKELKGFNQVHEVPDKWGHYMNVFIKGR